MGTRDIKHECTIAAAPDTVAAAIASPHGLGTWLCDDARSEKRPGGRLSFHWQDGRQCVGRWTEFDPPARLACRWSYDVAGPERTTTFELTSEGDGTRVTLTEGGVPEDEAEAVSGLWQQTLDDLRAYTEEGINARFLRQPMLGVYPEEVTDETVAKHGLAVEKGIYLNSVLPDAAAHGAGLAEGDVIVRVGEDDVTDWPSLGTALRAHSAGDTVTVHGWRGQESLSIDVTLQGRDRQEIPDSVDGVRQAVTDSLAEQLARFEAIMEGVTDAQAEHCPGEDEWCVKEVLAHLSLGERWGHDWLARLASDEDPAGFPGGPESLWQKALIGMPIEELTARFVADLKDTTAMSLAILDSDPKPWVVYQVGSAVLFGSEHTEDHYKQIETALEAARAVVAPA